MVKYIDIADDIRSKIFDKKYTYGQKLPYEYVLCVAYHCNKETMKKALDILVKEGLIVRRRGAGTFVKDYDASSEDATQLKQSGLGLTRKLKGKGELKSEIIEFSVIPSDEHISKKLQIEEGNHIHAYFYYSKFKIRAFERLDIPVYWKRIKIKDTKYA